MAKVIILQVSVKGKFGKALQLNGENQYVTLGGDAEIILPRVAA